MTLIEYDKDDDEFRINIGDCPVVISPALAIDLKYELDSKLRVREKYKNRERTPLRDEIIAKTIISQKKETGKFKGLKSSDFGV